MDLTEHKSTGVTTRRLTKAERDSMAAQGFEAAIQDKAKEEYKSALTELDKIAAIAKFLGLDR